MAEAVIGIIAEGIATLLVSQAIEKVGKLWGMKHELEALRNTIRTVRAVLDDAEEQYYQNCQVKVWLEGLKDAFYEAQYLLEEFNIEAMRRELRGHNEMMKEVRTFFSSSNQLAFKWKMSDEVIAVSRRIQDMNNLRQFHLDERPRREWRNRKEPHSFVCEGDIMGRDDAKETVMKFLLDSKENVSILPIVGIGGLGKTALAHNVYKGSNFDLKTWVCVSSDFDVEKIVKNIIACAKKKEPTEVPREQLQSELKATIDGKRCLLVLDDLWDVDPIALQNLKTLLEGGAKGSKILITTRNRLVAEITGIAPPYYLQGLSESLSFDLLLQMAGRKKEEIQDHDMLAIGKEIARKCSGVPLVVRTVGRLLYFKKTEREWSQFKDYKLPDVCQQEDDIITVLRLSYDHLPSHLKQCFAFCSLFPKDYEIRKQTLVDLWVAEGFVQSSKGGQHLEHIAHEYFKDLLWSNFFQDYHEDEETCKMHDLMHDLACSIAGSECWLARDDTQSLPARDDTQSLHGRTRHISYSSTSNLMGQLSCLSPSALRTILALRTIPSTYPKRGEIDLLQLVQSFKRLHILDLHDKNIEKVPRSICKLKHLTYLDLSNNDNLKRLPDSITGLHNLQTLNLNGCSCLEELPRGIRKLVSLRNLDIDHCWQLSYMPHGLGQLSSLQRLTRFILPQKEACAKKYCRLGELNGLNNIQGSLCIENLGSVTNVAVESKAANMLGKHSLQSLQLTWGDFDTDDAIIRDRDEALLDGLRPHSNLQKLTIDGYKGESFPSWMMDSLMSSLRHLVEAGFTSCGRCKHLPPLGQLPHLQSLYIHSMTELECIKSDHSLSLTASFPSLLKLEIYGCEKLREMPRAPHLEELRLWNANITVINGLNKLKRLKIWGMESLECLPEEGLKTLNSLDSLFIFDCPRLNSLSLGMRHLSNLVDLSIFDCEELDLCKDESGNILDFQGLERLRDVSIEELPKLESLPQWLMHASNLERLDICGCSNLKSIPEQIGALQSLQQLKIRFCPLLTSLPEGMPRLASLAHLTIRGCPDLEKRCERDAGEDWYKISHIPNIGAWMEGTWTVW